MPHCRSGISKPLNTKKHCFQNVWSVPKQNQPANHKQNLVLRPNSTKPSLNRMSRVKYQLAKSTAGFKTDTYSSRDTSTRATVQASSHQPKINRKATASNLKTKPNGSVGLLQRGHPADQDAFSHFISNTDNQNAAFKTPGFLKEDLKAEDISEEELQIKISSLNSKEDKQTALNLGNQKQKSNKDHPHSRHVNVLMLDELRKDSSRSIRSSFLQANPQPANNQSSLTIINAALDQSLQSSIQINNSHSNINHHHLAQIQASKKDAFFQNQQLHDNIEKHEVGSNKISSKLQSPNFSSLKPSRNQEESVEQSKQQQINTVACHQMQAETIFRKQVELHWNVTNSDQNNMFQPQFENTSNEENTPRVQICDLKLDQSEQFRHTSHQAKRINKSETVIQETNICKKESQPDNIQCRSSRQLQSCQSLYSEKLCYRDSQQRETTIMALAQEIHRKNQENNSFKPDIDKKSVISVKKQQLKPIHCRVEELLKKKQQKIQLIQQQEEKRKREADPEDFNPSFTPKLSKKTMQILHRSKNRRSRGAEQRTISQSREQHAEKTEDLNVFERNHMHTLVHQNKVQDIMNDLEQKMGQICTFTPCLNKKSMYLSKIIKSRPKQESNNEMKCIQQSQSSKLLKQVDNKKHNFERESRQHSQLKVTSEKQDQSYQLGFKINANTHHSKSCSILRQLDTKLKTNLLKPVQISNKKGRAKAGGLNRNNSESQLQKSTLVSRLQFKKSQSQQKLLADSQAMLNIKNWELFTGIKKPTRDDNQQPTGGQLESQPLVVQIDIQGSIHRLNNTVSANSSPLKQSQQTKLESQSQQFEDHVYSDAIQRPQHHNNACSPQTFLSEQHRAQTIPEEYHTSKGNSIRSSCSEQSEQPQLKLKVSESEIDSILINDTHYQYASHISNLKNQNQREEIESASCQQNKESGQTHLDQQRQSDLSVDLSDMDQQNIQQVSNEPQHQSDLLQQSAHSRLSSISDDQLHQIIKTKLKEELKAANSQYKTTIMALHEKQPKIKSIFKKLTKM